MLATQVSLERAKIFCRELAEMEDELLRRHRMHEDKEQAKRKRREAEVKGKALEKRHRQMMQMVAEAAHIPKASRHIQAMKGHARGGPGAPSAATLEAEEQMAAEEERRQVAEALLGLPRPSISPPCIRLP